jgi:hypothetical protein
MKDFHFGAARDENVSRGISSPHYFPVNSGESQKVE